MAVKSFKPTNQGPTLSVDTILAGSGWSARMGSWIKLGLIVAHDIPHPFAGWKTGPEHGQRFDLTFTVDGSGEVFQFEAILLSASWSPRQGHIVKLALPVPLEEANPFGGFSVGMEDGQKFAVKFVALTD